MLSPNRPARPIGIAALSAFFCFGTIASGLSSISLLTPGGPRGGFGISDTGISGIRAGRHCNRRDEVHEEAET